MANTQYISIVRLIEDCGFDYSGEIDFQRLKKLLLIGFSHSTDGFIQINEFSYSKQDVLEEIERSDFAARLPYHIKLWNSKGILQLLEKNEVTDTSFLIVQEFRQFENDPHFDMFFSSYFKTSFAICSRSLLKPGNYALIKLSELLAFEDFLKGGDREEAFKPIKIFLEEALKLFANLNNDNVKLFSTQLHPWIYESWDRMFNMLPDDLYQLKTDMVIGLINTSIKIRNTSKSDCAAIVGKLIELNNLPQDLKDHIVRLKGLYLIESDYSFKSSEEISFKNFFWIILLIIKLLFLMRSCN